MVKKAVQYLDLILKKIERRFSRLGISLRVKLIILFTAAALLALSVTVISFGTLRRTSARQTDSYQHSVIEGISKITEQYLLNCQRALMSLGSEPSFRRAVREKNYALLARDAERVYRRFKIFSFVAVVFRDGDSVFAGVRYPPDYPDVSENDEIRTFLRWNFSNPATRISPAYTHLGEKKVLTVHPVPGAVIAGGVDIQNLAELIGKLRPLEKSEVFVLDERGTVIMGPSGPGNLEFAGKSASLELEGGKNIAYHTLNPVFNWRMGLLTPADIVYRNIKSLRRLVIIFVIAGIVAALALALYFSRMITYPVGRLRRGAKILGAGNLRYRISLETGDELQDLADEFNKMGAELKKSYDSMGDKIKNATRDLEDALEEIEEKNKQIQKADRMKSRFLASMSHELRTPINAVIGFTSLMEEGTYGELSEKQKDTLEKIQRNTEHLLNLINDILDLSKIEAGKMDLLPEKFSLNFLLQQIKEEVKSLLDRKGLKFNIETEEEINCFNDYTRLRQILMNLISNAIKFTSEGSVTVRAGKKDDKKFYVEVSDTGTGIKEEDIEKIFEEFVQSDSSPARRFGGTGLGLSICLKLVNMMEGKIDIQSKWKEGSTFAVVLPLKIEEEPEEGGNKNSPV